MIKFKLDEILKELNISRTKFAHLADVRPNTINDMCNGNTKRIEVETLNNIMRTVNELSDREIKITDIICYIRDE
jgi:DNA-binding Xre family transcriptional regulator